MLSVKQLLKHLTSAIVVLWMVALASSVHATSFDCGKASTSVENAICADAELSDLDEFLSSLYRRALDSSGTAHDIKSSQRTWIRIRNACRDKACLKDAYTKRIDELTTLSSPVSRQTATMQTISEPDGTGTLLDPGVGAPPPPPEPPAVGAADMQRFETLHVKDELIGTEAFSMLIPTGWIPRGGVVWRRNPFKPATAAMRVTSPDGLTRFEILPQMPFVDGAREANMQAVQVLGPSAVAAMAERFAEGQLYFGNEVRERIDEPTEFLRRIVIPRFRADLQDLRILEMEDMPEVAQAIAAAEPAEPGSRKSVHVGRARIEFSEGRQVFEEDIYAVLLLVDIPAIRQTYWGAEHLLAFRAPKGQLNSQTPVLRTICNSFRIDLDWYNKYSQLVATLIQGEIREIRAVGEFSRRWAEMSDDISRDRQKSWEDLQARQDEMNRRYSQYQRGLQDYRDADGNRVELPSGYNHAWASRGEEFIVTDNPNFNPNVELDGTWMPLEQAN